jgi:hypothetical protein
MAEYFNCCHKQSQNNSSLLSNLNIYVNNVIEKKFDALNLLNF